MVRGGEAIRVRCARRGTLPAPTRRTTSQVSYEGYTAGAGSSSSNSARDHDTTDTAARRVERKRACDERLTPGRRVVVAIAIAIAITIATARARARALTARAAAASSSLPDRQPSGGRGAK